MTPRDPENLRTAGFFKYPTGGVLSAEDEDSLRIHQEIFHSDINFVIGWVFIASCLIGGVALGIGYKDQTIKTGGFGLAATSLGAVIQRQASKPEKIKNKG